MLTMFHTKSEAILDRVKGAPCILVLLWYGAVQYYIVQYCVPKPIKWPASVRVRVAHLHRLGHLIGFDHAEV